jgi:ribonuclease BN (tRNA processing enzyme)
MHRRHLLQLAALCAASSAGIRAAQSARSRLILLGTQGGPNFLAARAESANVLQIGNRLYLVDCGYGALANLIRANLNYRQVEQVFLTHLHDDHTADLPSLIGHQWTGGRITPVQIHGPAGTKRLVDAAIAFNALSEEIRLVDEARSVRIRSLYRGLEVAAGATAVTAYQDEWLQVTAFENTHYPAESKQRMRSRALSYRFDCPDRSIVFSGDTAVSTSLIALAKGADVLVCEAMDVGLMRKAFDVRVAQGAYADNPEGVWHHIVTTHTTTEQAGEMAAAAGVKTLIMNHLVPGALADVDDELYASAARRHFSGTIVVGRDLLEL